MAPTLIPPTARLHRSWLAGRDEWGRGVHQDGAAVWRADAEGLDLDDPAQFARWVEILLTDADPTADLPPGLVPATTLWIVDGDTHLGAVQLRHRLNPALAITGGHIGYGIRPGARRRGLAGFALTGALERAGRLGLSEVMLTCDEDNPGSIRTIENAGGRLTASVPAEAGTPAYRRYLITVPSVPAGDQ